MPTRKFAPSGSIFPPFNYTNSYFRVLVIVIIIASIKRKDFTPKKESGSGKWNDNGMITEKVQ